MNGWNENTGQTNHGELIAYVKGLANPHYVASDALEAMTLNPNGHKAGYYADLVSYCAMRLTGNL